MLGNAQMEMLGITHSIFHPILLGEIIFVRENRWMMTRATPHDSGNAQMEQLGAGMNHDKSSTVS